MDKNKKIELTLPLTKKKNLVVTLPLIKTKKIVINNCFGGFGLSYEAVMMYAELSNIKLNAYVNKKVDGHTDFIHLIKYENPSDTILGVIHYLTSKLNDDGTLPDHDEGYFSERKIKRDDPILVKVVEKLGKKANGKYSELKIVEIPDDVEWEIDEYDGLETVEEAHRSWN